MTPAHSVSDTMSVGRRPVSGIWKVPLGLARDGLQADLSSSSQVLSQLTIKCAQSGAETEATAPCRTCS
jgi:hypothetical protein